MGSSLAPTLASFAMHMIESKIIEMPIFYKRFVDDSFAIFNSEDEALNFLEYLNSIHKNIQFTMEAEVENTLKFLDVTVHRFDEKLQTSWSVKDTNTGVYIPKCAFAPQKYKRAAIRSLIFRAKNLSSSSNFYDSAFCQIRKTFMENGYHADYINKIRAEVDSQVESKPVQENVKNIFWRLPYIKDKEQETLRAVRTINRILPDHFKLNVVFQTAKTASIFPNKDKVSPCLSSNVVYKFTCRQCYCCYVGETRRHLVTRINEHLNGRPQDTEITKHRHVASNDDFAIVFRTKHTRIAESLVIKSTKNDKLLNEHESSIPLLLFDL